MTDNDLERFKKAQELDFATALAEIRNGRKVSPVSYTHLNLFSEINMCI